jgi:regulator of sigma D
MESEHPYKSGLQQLAELAPALKASTERLRNYNDAYEQQQKQSRRPVVVDGSPWGNAVASLNGKHHAQN